MITDVEVIIAIIAFFAGVFASPPPIGVCANPGYSSPDVSIALPIEVGINPPDYCLPRR
jgi:hypothetical protein